MQHFFRDQSYLKYNVIALVLSNLAAALNYTTSIYLARSLSVEGYGIYYALQASSPVFFSMVAFIPCSILNAIAAFKNDKEKAHHLVSNLLRIYGALSAGLMFVLFSSLTFMMKFLNVLDFNLMVIFALTWCPILMMSFLQGLVQGHLLFKHLTIKDAFLSLAKILLMILFISGMNFGYIGAALAELLATTIVAGWMFLSIRKYIPMPTFQPRSFLWKEIFSIWRISFLPAVSMSLIGFLMMVDIVAVKHFFSDFESGIYTAGATLGRIPFIFSGVLVTLLFPQIANDGEDDQAALKNLGITAGIVGISALLFSVMLSWQGERVLSALFGSHFIASETAMIWVLVSSSLLAMVNVLFNYMLAKRYWTFLIPCGAVVGFSFYRMKLSPPSETFQIPQSFSWMLGEVLIVGVFFMFYYHRKSFVRRP